MSGAKFTDEFKRDAVAQVEDRGYPRVRCTTWMQPTNPSPPSAIIVSF
ncbi:hypothetical protein ACEN2J_18130 [Pseudorhodobacter sp. W20_MBD10_FR17]